MRRIHCTFLDSNRQLVPVGTPVAVRLVTDTAGEQPATARVGEPGRLFVDVGPSTPKGHGAYLTVTALGAETTVRVITPVDGPSEGPLVQMPAVALPAITINGRGFYANGAPWTWQFASDFTLLYRLMRGEDITPVLQQRKAAGANGVRVFLMLHYLEQNYPQAYPDFWTTLVPFARFLASHGLYVEFTCLADAQVIMPSTGDQQAFVQRVADTLRGESNVFLELANEYPKNGVNPSRFDRPAGVISSHGSGLADSPPALPSWDYSTWHGRRDWPKVVLSHEDAWFVGEGIDANGAVTGVPHPIVMDEPMGFGEVDEPGRRSTDPELARVLALTSIAFGNGGTFHSEAGLRSQLWGPTQERCARAFFAALDGRPYGSAA